MPSVLSSHRNSFYGRAAMTPVRNDERKWIQWRQRHAASPAGRTSSKAEARHLGSRNAQVGDDECRFLELQER